MSLIKYPPAVLIAAVLSTTVLATEELEVATVTPSDALVTEQVVPETSDELSAFGKFTHWLSDFSEAAKAEYYRLMEEKETVEETTPPVEG